MSQRQLPQSWLTQFRENSSSMTCVASFLRSFFHRQEATSSRISFSLSRIFVCFPGNVPSIAGSGLLLHKKRLLQRTYITFPCPHLFTYAYIILTVHKPISPVENEKKFHFYIFSSDIECHSSLGTTFFFKKYPFQPEPLFVIIHSLGNLQ